MGILDSKLIKPWVDLVYMWDEVYDEYRNRKFPDHAIALQENIYANSNFSYSGRRNVSAYYIVEQLPEQLEIGYKRTLRSLIPQGISLNVIELDEPFEINWNDPAFKNRMMLLEDVSIQNQEEQSGKTAYSGHKYHKDNEKDESTIRSLEYVQTATLRSELMRKLVKVRTMLILTGERGAEFEETLDEFEKTVNNRAGMSVKRVTVTIASEMRALSPYARAMVGSNAKRIPYQLATDEIRARYHSYEQGVTGYGDVYLGTNIETNSPVFKQFKRSVTDAEILLILGASDAGKSFIVKGISSQLMADKSYVVTVNDYEGGEYEMLGVLMDDGGKSVEIDFSKGSGRYYDPVPLTPTGNAKNDENMFSIASDAVKQLFRAIADDETLSNNKWVKIIIDNGVDNFYSSIGVSSNPATWVNTQGKSIYDVYESLKQYRPLEDDGLEEFLSDRAYFIEKFAPYLDRERKVNSYFTNPVSLHDILDADIVLCNYNMRGVAAETLSELDSVLIPFNASIIAYYRTIFPFAQGRYNVKIWEELPRFRKHRNAVSLLKTHIVGGRKMGDVNIIATNDPKELVSNDDFALFDNYTLAMVGKIGSKTTRDKVAKELDLMELIDELDAIGNVADDTDTTTVGYEEVMANPYKKAFLTKLDTGVSAVLKMSLPKWLVETPLFKTGVDREEED